jgi:dephospho-CoA kinase
MSTFIVRVQLTRESQAHYTLLRDKLLAIGFTKRIKSKQGIEYRLPNGNYLIDSDQDIDTITNAVKKVALRVDRTPMILITESKSNEWVGLQKC